MTELLVLISIIVFAIMSYPFFTSASGGLSCIIGVLILIYSLLVYTNVDDSGINEMVIDDSEKGLRRSFTIWTISVAVAIGIAVSAGFSHPELLKPSLTSSGSWRFAEGKGFEITPAFTAMILGLTLFTASVVAEIVRGSIQALPRGQVEAAISLGLSPFQRLRLVILPQALRSMIPLLNNQFMNVWKNSSLAIIVAYNDVFYQFLVMANNVGKLIPLFLLLLVTYQFGSLMISAVMNWFNARVTSVKI
jgi:general L-amino acid transport system permease protein